MVGIQSSVEKPGVKKLDLMDKIWTKVKPEEKEDQIIACMMRMAHNVVGAEASSLLLLTDHDQELYFKLTDIPQEQKLKRVHPGRKSEIAKWILKNKKPIIVNNPKKNADFYKKMDNATNFKTRCVIGMPIISNDKVIGVIEALNRPGGLYFTQQNLKAVMGVATTAAMTIESNRLNSHLLLSYRATVEALVAVADTKEIATVGHSRRVAEYALMAADELAIDKETRVNIEYAALLHDIGKLDIADEILNKADALSDKEWDLIKKHTIKGYNMLRNVPFLKGAARLILYHHERYDGSGYPQGLNGQAIPIGARLIAVADAFDSMTTDHNYRQAIEQKKAFSELNNNMCTQFCPVAVKAFSAGFVSNRLRQTSDENAPRLIDF